MEDKNVELLFEYLRSILYDAEVDKLNIESLDEPYKKLGLGLKYLDEAVTEMKSYSAALAKGNLSVQLPTTGNPLCANLKNIHADLNHLTWQAKEVAKGDYSQKVSYLGEFSEAFNSMTQQLEERERLLKAETAREKAHALALEAQVHLDELTRVGNRGFFNEMLTECLAAQEQTILCYCDLDHLKQINDEFGHDEGDTYIRSFVDVVKKHIRSNDIFARIGGDEFCILLRGCQKEVAIEKVKRMQKLFKESCVKSYPQSFSCGILDLSNQEAGTDLTEVMKQADAMMYEQKKAKRA